MSTTLTHDHERRALPGIDADSTSIGPAADWPERLRTVFDLMSSLPAAACLFWGPDGVMLYNRAWAAAIGPAHPKLWGRPVAEASDRLRRGYDARLAPGSDSWPDLTDALLPLVWRNIVDRPTAGLSATPIAGDDGPEGVLVEITLAPVPAAGSRVPPPGLDAEQRNLFMLQLSDALIQLDDPAQIDATTARMLAQRLKADRVSLYRVGPGPGDWTRSDHASAGLPLLPMRLTDRGAATAAGTVLSSGLPLLIRDLARAPADALAPFRAELGADHGALLVAPTLRAGAPIAALAIWFAAPRVWHPEDISLAVGAGARSWEAAERARTAAALRDSEMRHRALFQSIDEGVCLFEPAPPRPDGLRDYRYVSMNPAMQKMFGIPDLSGQSIRDNFPDEVEDWYDDYDRVLETGEPIRLVRESEPQGMVLEMFVTRVDGTDGRRLLAVMQDVTARARAEHALRRQDARKAFLLRLSDRLRALEDPVEIEAEACRILAEWLDVDRAYFVAIDESTGTARVARDYVRHGAGSLSGEHALADFGWSVSILRGGACQIISDSRTSPLIPDADRAASVALGIIASMAAPLIKRGTLVGALSVTVSAPRTWTDEEVTLLEDVAERIWATIARAQAESALRRSEARFRALVTATSYSVYRMSPDWREMRELDGHGFLRDTPSPTTDWLTDYIDPEDQPLVMAAIRTAIETRSLFELEHRVKRPDGTLGWTYSRAVPLLDEAGEIIEWFGAASDVTERRRVEEAIRQTELRLRLAQQAAGVGTFDWIAETGQADWSPELLDMMGLRPGALGGRFEDWVAMIHPEDRERAAACLDDALEDGVLEGEWRVIRPDGAVMWVLVRGAVERNAQGRAARVTGAQVDITDRVRSEQQVRFLIAELDARMEELRRQIRDKKT